MAVAVIDAYEWQLQVFEAMQNPAVEQIACVGSRGPGKSWTAKEVGVMRALEMPGTNHILFRRTSDDIVKQYVPQVAGLLNDYHGHGRIDYNYNSVYKVFTIHGRGGASRLFLGFAEIEKHAEKHMSMEYATAIFDEVTHFEEIIPQLIGGSVRGHRNLKKLYFGNPGGIGHQWVRRRFVKPATRDKKTLVLQPSLADNIVLAREDPGYADRLTAGLPEWKKKQWLRGDWDANEGQYFDVPPGCIRHVKVPSYAHVYAGVDWGYQDPFAVVWMAVWRDPWTGRHRCHVFADLKAFRKLDAIQAQMALDMEESELFEDMPPVKARFADPSTGKKTETDSDEQTRTTARTWARNGFVTIPAKRTGRVPGWTLMRQFLTPLEGYVNSDDPEQQHGVMTISPRCLNLLEELQGGQHEKIMGHMTDDLADPDHSCFVAGTMVATDKGNRQVEDIRVGEMVLTRKGYMPVLDNMKTKEKPVFTVTFSDGTAIEGSGDHPVFIEGEGFTRLDALRYNDMCLKHTGGISCQNSKSLQRGSKPSSSMGLSSAVIPTRSRQRTGAIFIREEPTEQREWVRFIRRCGERIMEQSRRVPTFITRTRILSTTLSTTWNVSPRRSIPVSTLLQNGQKDPGSTLTVSGISQKSGTLLLKGWNGIDSMDKRFGQAEIQSRTSVRFAVANTKQEPCREASSVPITVSRHGGEIRDTITWRDLARFAGNHLLATSTWTPELVRVSVVEVCESGSKPVYNLTVGGEPEYFANGILVHNCDALRYMLNMVYNMQFPQSKSLPYVKKTKLITARGPVLSIGAR